MQVPQPPGPDGQPAAPRLAQVLAPVMPMMMPYGMGYGMGYGGVAGHQYPPYGLPPLTPQFAGTLSWMSMLMLSVQDCSCARNLSCSGI